MTALPTVIINTHTHVCLTFLLVEDQLSLELPPLVQGALDLGREPVARFRAVQEVTRAALLHELGSGVSCEFAETIGAVDNGVERLHLGVSQDKVAVWKEKKKTGHNGS